MKTILIIDDEVDIQSALGFFLKRKGFDVLTASNGQEGIAILRDNPKRPDLILLDGNMPVMNGREFLKVRKDQNVSPNVSVILLSSDLWDVQDPSILRQIPKPFELNFLLETIETILNRKPAPELPPN